MFVVAATIFVGLLTYVLTTKSPDGIISPTPKLQGQTRSTMLEGTVVDVNVSGRSMSVEAGEKLVTVALSEGAELWNERGDAVLLPYLEHSFSVSAQGYFTGENAFLAERVRIVNRPLIIVLSPRPNEVIRSPLAVQGKAKGARGEIVFRIFDGDTGILAEGKAITGNPSENEYTSFQTTATFREPKSDGGLLEISGLGLEESTLTVPVRFRP